MFSALNTRLVVGLLLLFGVVTLFVDGSWRRPNNDQGYAPVQPLEFSHRIHAGDLGLDCLFCHYGARSSPVAGIPPTGLCMNCHATVTAGWDDVRAEQLAAEAEGRDPARLVSPELSKLYRAVGLDDELQPIEGATPHGLEWVRVHDMPDFVAFDHSTHVARDLACQTCHGPVQSMDRLRQESSLSMGWCLDCHRSKPADPGFSLSAEHGELAPGQHVSTDCAACHY